MKRPLKLFVLVVALAFIGFMPKKSEATMTYCDNSQTCYSTCTFFDDSGNILRRYILRYC